MKNPEKRVEMKGGMQGIFFSYGMKRIAYYYQDMYGLLELEDYMGTG